MKLLSSLALLATAVTANPILARHDASKPFHLKTASASNQDHNGLYVCAYHTGAGLNDAVLTQDEGKASPAVLNGSTTQFQLSELQWGLLMPAVTNYAAWTPVRINAGMASEGFVIKDHQLVWSRDAFAGWLVCDWYHNAPQLFYLYSYMKPEIPSSCSTVDLRVEYTQ
ncbi:hypothetical protein PHISP_04835 [Aspergillus sp. HF37]|nr:hypothetical protein PHISP_04835 [Aspergillus sp. HF37]